MKMVKEISLDLGVSQVTVYNHIKKLDKELIGNIFKKQGVTYLDDEGIRQIKISMGLIQVPVIKENISMNEIIESISRQVTDNIKEELKREMQEELEKQKNIIIEQVTQRQLEQIQVENNKLMNYLSETREQEKNKSFFSRLFKK